MIAIFVAGGFALLCAALATPLLIKTLRLRGIGQQIREDGPQRHVAKAGTPTMGGVAIVGAIVVGYFAAHLRLGAPITSEGILVLISIVGFGLVGFLDDWIKVRHHRSLGLTKSGKLGGQILVALIVALGSRYWAHLPASITFVRSGALDIHFPTAVWVIFAVLVIIGASNAVNLSDGLDGLAAGSSIFAFSIMGIIGYWQFRHFSVYGVGSGLDLAIMSVAMTGACAGFLWWNAPPARIFMGDTGSLALGAGLGALGLEMHLDLLLPIIAGLFVIITLSVVIQVASFRLFHRRVFRMAPLHHHFELLGWPETTVIIRFWILAGLFTAVALGLFYADFLSLGQVVK
ncbi:MAG: phospho-N-acetylmuramoyl-pentapeptide-transferase [Actinobacteria bacterium]|nr:phospho-N-acetylmuramoyl-pentapeptide-transferase [Actinomycetota bacterium]